MNQSEWIPSSIAHSGILPENDVWTYGPAGPLGGRPALAQTVTNTATIIAPTGLTEDNTTDNSAADSDNVLVQLTIIKRVTNDNGGDATATSFGITTSAGTLSFGANTGTATNAVYTSTILNVEPGTYSLSELDTAGYTEGTWTCSGTGFSAVSGAFGAGSVTLAESAQVTCEITNDDQGATLTLIKNVDNSGGGTATADQWTLTAIGPQTLSGVTGNASVTNVAVLPGSYSLAESGGPADSGNVDPDYTNAGWDCGPAGSGLTAVNVVLGASVSCTLTNVFVGYPSLALTKTVASVTDTNGNSITDAGDVIHWSFDVHNTGNVPLTNVTVADTLADVVLSGGPIATLASGAHDTTTFTASYTIKVSDVPGSVVNSATASGSDPDDGTIGSPPSTTTTTTVSQPSLALTKTVASVTDTNGNSITDAGDVIHWSFDVHNTGNVPLTNVTVADTLADVVLSGGPIATLASGAHDTTTFTASYTIKVSDVPGSVVNSATASGSDPDDGTIGSPPSTTTTTTVSQPSLALTKTVASVTDTNGNSITDAGDVIHWSFDVHNTGNVPLTNVTVADTLADVVLSGGPIATLASGAHDTTTFTASYTIKVSDVPGSVVNSATASGSDPDDGTIGSPPSTTTTTTVAVVPQPKIALIKHASEPVDTNGDGLIGGAGDAIDYEFTVMNVGNMPLTDVRVTDTLVAVSGGPLASLAVGQSDSSTFTAHYVLTQADVDDGQVVNTATAFGTVEGGEEVTDISDSGSPTLDNPTVTLLAQNPAIQVTKVAALTTDGLTPGKGNIGDVITYTVMVHNIGNVTIERFETIDTLQNQAPTALDCTPTRLLPGQTATCRTYTHTITEADVDAGVDLENKVVVTGFPARGKVTAGSEAAVEVEATPVVLRVTKSAAPRDVRVGDLVRYTVTVENLSPWGVSDVTLIDTPPAGFTYVDKSLTVADQDDLGRLAGTYPIRVDQLDIEADGKAILTYLLRVGAGVRSGIHINHAHARRGSVTSNVATAEVQLVGDPLIDETLILGTVFDDRDHDGWQDTAALSDIKVSGGFAPGAYIPNSTTIDRGKGMQPEVDASAPLLHGLEFGQLSARQSDADPIETHRIVIRQKLSSPAFTDDFVLTTRQGLTYRMTADGQTSVERSGDAKAGLTGADLVIERQVTQVGDGLAVDYVITNHGVDERGIPGVRIASVEGLISETDQFGRYHIVGISGGAWERGRNFILKLDTATLPEGAALTTANPLLRRITPGIPVRFDWGVKLPDGLIEGAKKTIEIELGSVLFNPGSALIRPGTEGALDSVAEQIRGHEGGEIVISATGETPELAYARAQSVQAALRDRVGDVAIKGTVVTLRTVPSDNRTGLLSLAANPVLRDVFFDTDETAIKAKYVPVIAAIATDIEKMKGGVVGIVGYADRRASDVHNTDLAMRRSKAVFDAIARLLSPEARAKLRVEVSQDPSAPLTNGGR
ncbi:DUF7507 domain-containing protein [Caenibius tardaugens]